MFHCEHDRICRSFCFSRRVSVESWKESLLCSVTFCRDEFRKLCSAPAIGFGCCSSFWSVAEWAKSRFLVETNVVDRRCPKKIELGFVTSSRRTATAIATGRFEFVAEFLIDFYTCHVRLPHFSGEFRRAPTKIISWNCFRRRPLALALLLFVDNVAALVKVLFLDEETNEFRKVSIEPKKFHLDQPFWTNFETRRVNLLFSDWIRSMICSRRLFSLFRSTSWLFSSSISSIKFFRSFLRVEN